MTRINDTTQCGNYTKSFTRSKEFTTCAQYELLQTPLSPTTEDTSKTTMKAKDRMYMVDSGASLHLIGESSLNAQERTHVRKTKDDLEFQCANGIVRTTKERKVHSQELGTYLYVKVVDSLGRFCDELGFSYSWQPGENHILPKR